MDVAVVGCGYWGPNLVRNFTAISDCERLVCCDSDPEKLNRIKSLYPHVTTVQSFDDVVGDPKIQAVVIATPVATHFPLAEKALLAKKHVLVEKPMAASSEECLELTRLAERMGCVLMVGHTFEHSVAVNQVRHIINAGELGEILYLSFQRLNLGPYRSDVNVVWDLAAHDVSIVLFLLATRPVGVNAQGQAFLKKGNEDIANTVLHFENGTVAFLNDSWLDPHKVRRATVVGTKKMLVYDDVSIHEKIKIFDKGIDTPREYDTFADFHFSYRYGDIHSPRIEDQEPLKVQCTHFVDCIKESRTPSTDGKVGTAVVCVLEAISESMRNRGEYVPINYPTETGNVPTQKRDFTAPALTGELDKKVAIQ